MADETTLRDGTPAVIWPLLPDDREGLRVGYSRLSDSAKYSRFLSGIGDLSEGLLRVLVDSVDGVDHVALLLLAVPPDADDALAGVARMVRYPGRPTDADVAVTVGDGWQGRGVATALLAALLARRPRGVTRLVTQVGTDNPASLAMLRRLGTLRTTGQSGGAYDVVVDLPPDDARGPDGGALDEGATATADRDAGAIRRG